MATQQPALAYRLRSANLRWSRRLANGQPVYHRSRLRRGAREGGLVPTGKWFTEELIVEGDRLVVKVNGKTTADYHDVRPIEQGHIALQLHDAKTKVEFRKIEIQELGQSAARDRCDS